MEIKELIEQVKAASEALKAAQEKHDAELKAHGEASAETKAAVEQMAAELKEAGEKMVALDKKLIELELEAKRFREGAGIGKKSIGALFVESEVYEGVKSSGRGNNAPVSIARKDITGTAASAGALVRPDRDPEVYSDPRRSTRIRDLIPATPVQGGSVEVMRLATRDNQAGPQQASSNPSSAVGGGELQPKNQSSYTWELVTYPVRTIAHWVPASRQVLSDAPMLQSVIDSELVYGLDLESDEQLLLGDGTGQNVVGLLVDAAIPDIGGLAAGTTNVSAAMIDHIRAAVTDLQTREYYNPNGIVMNPVDWGAIETAKDDSGQYLMLQFPAEGARERVWRMPVVVTNAMPQGEFIVGDWQMGARLYEREDIQVRVSESHADFFVRNGVAILAEERYAFAITRPGAFAKGNFEVSAS